MGKRSRSVKLEHAALCLGVLILSSTYFVHRHMELKTKYQQVKAEHRRSQAEFQVKRTVTGPLNSCQKRMRIKPHNYTRKSVISEAPGWAQLLREVAGSTGTVTVATGTANYAAAMNSFFVISIQQHNIGNFLFVALSDGMCPTKDKPGLLHPSARCVQYPFIYNEGGMFGTQEFKEVVAVKTDLLLGIIEENYAVLLSDADIVFFVNPLAELERIRQSKEAQLVIQSDSSAGLNSGFMYLNPTESSRQFLVDVVLGQEADPVSSQQKIINRLIKCIGTHSLPFTHVMLPEAEWPCGNLFHGHGDASHQGTRHYAWDPPCEACRVYHNNWVVGEHAKVLRFRELLLWADDTDQYYSSATTTYLSVDNPDEGEREGSEQREMLVLAMQLGSLLGRVVILPWLRCTQRRPSQSVESQADTCTLNEVLWMQNWIDVFGVASWREATFRYNPLTHPDVRLRHNLAHYTRWADSDNRVKPGWLDPSRPTKGKEALQPPPEKVHVISRQQQPESTTAGETVVHVPRHAGVLREDEAREMLDVADRVLRIHSLYDFKLQLQDPKAEASWAKKLKMLDRAQGSAGMEILNHKAKPPKERWKPSA